MLRKYDFYVLLRNFFSSVSLGLVNCDLELLNQQIHVNCITLVILFWVVKKLYRNCISTWDDLQIIEKNIMKSWSFLLIHSKTIVWKCIWSISDQTNVVMIFEWKIWNENSNCISRVQWIVFLILISYRKGNNFYKGFKVGIQYHQTNSCERLIGQILKLNFLIFTDGIGPFCAATNHLPQQNKAHTTTWQPILHK